MYTYGNHTIDLWQSWTRCTSLSTFLSNQGTKKRFHRRGRSYL